MYTWEGTCHACGKRFLVRTYSMEEHEGDETVEWFCPKCRKSLRKQAEEAREREEYETRRQQAEADHKEFLERLMTWNVVSVDDIRPENEKTLYIIGNGFDLMHQVPSSYYHFRDTLGKNNRLRCALEDYITVKNLWSDFENALAHFDISAMTNEYGLDTLLDMTGAYDEDSGAAEYFMSVETAAGPINTVVSELPRRLRMWVEALTVGTHDRPLRNMFVNGKVLDFNYTEFVESLYGVPKENVCYIHGCRVKQKGRPREPLILGHMRGASDEAFEENSRSKNRLRGYKRAFVEMAQTSVIDFISDCDESLTKDTDKIIKAHESFFAGLSQTETVIAIGHSFALTDGDYFSKIKSSIDDIENVKWFFGCYGLRDLNNLEVLLEGLGIEKSDVMIFRTDTIKTTPFAISTNKVAEKEEILMPVCSSEDGKWTVERLGHELHINSVADNTVDYSVTIPGGFKRAFFVASDNCLLIVKYDIGPGVLLFRNIESHWKFMGELFCDHQHLLVDRLKNVYITEDDITFVYNNRIRKYSLTDGALICNKKVGCTRNKHFDGKDIMRMFTRDNI